MLCNDSPSEVMGAKTGGSVADKRVDELDR